VAVEAERQVDEAPAPGQSPDGADDDARQLVTPRV
jgi:hypothetical protein